MTKEKKTVQAIVVQSYLKKTSPIVKKIEAVKITTKDQYEAVAANIAKIKEFVEEAETEAAKFTDPAKAIIKQTNTFFNPFFKAMENAEKLGKAAMLEFINSNQSKADKIEGDFESGKIKRISTVTSKTSELRDTSSDNSSVKKIYKLTIVDAKKIPREFLVPDETAIKEAFKRGEKVAGCKYEQENTIAIPTKKKK